ncbi:zinc ABC transporter substrate-binding protein [Cohnella sp. CBP 2801]|uniref:Zinc ABC transporter substrate-binding protein n=2 Tax=Cohnella zeiphila TaxID=2761120 RepID=A0A7X0VUR2_9BACL|nr:zinc ABC transporter substrate-binding protein [Cohnella zeiphila]
MMLLAAGSALLAGCGGGKDQTHAEGKVSVVTTFYPLYFLAERIGGDDAQAVNLIPTGVEPHDWSPKSRDLQTVSEAELFIYNGAGLEGWVDDFLQGIGNGPKTVEASQGIELISGNPEADEEGEVGADDRGVDPHTWVSPKSMMKMASNVHDAFVAEDPAHQADYDANYSELQSKLQELDRQFADGLANVSRRDIVVSHQAFGYLCRDYGLKQVPIMGLSPDAEPRAQDLLNIAKFVKENGVKTIFFEELTSDQLAKTLASEANVGTDVLNPLEGLTPAEVKAGDDYFSIMQRNLQNLQKALQ